jgi:hypothetical protein
MLPFLFFEGQKGLNQNTKEPNHGATRHLDHCFVQCVEGRLGLRNETQQIQNVGFLFVQPNLNGGPNDDQGPTRHINHPYRI